MAADIQQWLDDPASNYGWILAGNESANQTTKRFATRENSDEGHRPLLTVEYTGGEAPAAPAAPNCGNSGASGLDGYSSDD